MAVEPAQYQAVRVPKVSDVIARTLRSQIIRGELAPDAALPPEAALMAQFNVSRPTLREAYRILESEGLITIRRGALGGPRVQVPSADIAARYAGMVLQHQGTSLGDLASARQIIEPPAAGILASRASAADIAELEAVIAAETDHRVDQREIWQDPFHLKVVELAGNQTLALFTHMTGHIMQVAKAIYLDKTLERGTTEGTESLHLAERAHHKLIEQIKSGDAAKAELFWFRHLKEASERILAAMPEVRAIDLLN